MDLDDPHVNMPAKGTERYSTLLDLSSVNNSNITFLILTIQEVLLTMETILDPIFGLGRRISLQFEEWR